MRVEFPPPPHNYDNLKKKDVKEVAKEFEAVMIHQILKEAFRSLTSGKSFQERTYYDMFLEKVAEQIARAGGLGLADYIVDSVEKLKSNELDLRAIVRNKLKERGLPPWLEVIPEVESNYNPDAVSPKGAVGLWQLMKDTAKALGLRVDDEIDERRDPIKSTDAALRYIEYLLDKFGDWKLVFIAYNWGETNLQRHLEEKGSLVLEELPKETREYLNRILSRINDRYRYSQK